MIAATEMTLVTPITMPRIVSEDRIFRERSVPRMLELAVARADGDSSRPPEINRYAARSAAEKKARLTGH